jgi:ceramide glucosyltransferase
MLLAAIALAAAVYQLLAFVAAMLFRRAAPLSGGTSPSVSILKPVHGADPGFIQAVRSNAAQRYRDFEILFGVASLADPAVPLIRQLESEFANIRFVQTHTYAPNAKVASLIDLEREARGEILVVSDSDILAPEGYLERVVAPLADRAVGLVTCLYRARSETWAGRFEALGVATDFAPGAMLAPFVGVDEFGLGSTLAFRAADLHRIGGFAAVADYLADDYQLGRKIHSLGLKCVLSDVIVETHLRGESWVSVWRHQVRWARTVRVSRTGGYAGLPITFATLWAIAAACGGHWWIACFLLALRLAMAIAAGYFVLRSPDVLRLVWLIPVRDLFGVAVWIAGLTGSTVEWGGKRLRIRGDGRIQSTVNSTAVRR